MKSLEKSTDQNSPIPIFSIMKSLISILFFLETCFTRQNFAIRCIRGCWSSLRMVVGKVRSSSRYCIENCTVLILEFFVVEIPITLGGFNSLQEPIYRFRVLIGDPGRNFLDEHHHLLEKCKVVFNLGQGSRWNGQLVTTCAGSAMILVFGW